MTADLLDLNESKDLTPVRIPPEIVENLRARAYSRDSMKICRAIICLLLSLTLVGQGVAASPLSSTGSPKPGMANACRMKDLPCHGAIQKVKQARDHKRSCCNKSCPDMTACALGQPAAFSASPFVFPETSAGSIAHKPLAISTNLPSPLFRPPITLLG